MRSVRTWFVCKCERSFEEISEFIQHKYQEHFFEFQYADSIIFDERIDELDHQDSENTLKVETDSFSQNDELPSPSNMVNSITEERILPDPDPEQISSCQFTNGGQENVVDFRIEEDTVRVNVRPLTWHKSKLRATSVGKAVSENLEFEADECKTETHFYLKDALEDETATTFTKNPFVSIRRLTINEIENSSLTSSSSDRCQGQVHGQGQAHMTENVGVNSVIGAQEEISSLSCNSADPDPILPHDPADPDSDFDKGHSSPKTRNTKKDSLPRKKYGTKDTDFNCPHHACHKVFKKARDLNRHAKKHNGQQNSYFVFPTHEEDDPESSKLPLRDWLKKQADDTTTQNFVVLDPDPLTTENLDPISFTNPITCKLCLLKLVSEAELRIHVKHCWLRNKRKHHYCVHCKKTIHATSKLRRHNLRMHPTEEEKFTRFKFLCEICSRGFFENKEFLIHSDSHKNLKDQNRPFACQQCDSRFYTKTLLIAHGRTHSTVAAFTCPRENCGKNYKTQRDLNKHERLQHLNPKMFPCSQEGCSSEPFKTLQSRKVHEATHTGQQLYKCDKLNCDKLFLTTKGLQFHLDLNHRDTAVVKLFACDICKKKFFTKALVRTHLKVHSGQRPFRCSKQDCISTFKRRGDLNRHEERHIAKQQVQGVSKF